jgi:hypothetical protein
LLVNISIQSPVINIMDAAESEDFSYAAALEEGIKVGQLSQLPSTGESLAGRWSGE